MGEVEKAALRETHQRLYGGSARRPKFSPLFQANSKLFQGKSKLFQAFSKEFQTFSLAVSNEINALAAPPGDFAFFATPAPEFLSRCDRARRPPPAQALAEVLSLPRFPFFRKKMPRRCGGRLSVRPAGARRWPGRAL
jgi:hypothetical protein